MAWPALLGHRLLHGGAHAAAAPSSSFEPAYAVASAALVGGVGGALYWYYGRRVSP